MPFLQHYQKCKAGEPHTTSAAIVLPVWPKASWWPMVRNWQPLKFFPKGTPLFSAAPEREGEPRPKAGPTKWPIVVLYDGPEAAVASSNLPEAS